MFYLKAQESVEYVTATSHQDSDSSRSGSRYGSILQNGHQGSVTSDSSDRSTEWRGKKGLRKKGKGSTGSPSTASSRKHGGGLSALNNSGGPLIPNKVTFNDMPTGVTRDITMLVDPYRHNYGRRSSLCETLFGIVPGRFHSNSQQEMNGSCRDDRIMVQGLLPGGEAIQYGVKIGKYQV